MSAFSLPIYCALLILGAHLFLNMQKYLPGELCLCDIYFKKYFSSDIKMVHYLGGGGTHAFNPSFWEEEAGPL